MIVAGAGGDNERGKKVTSQHAKTNIAKTNCFSKIYKVEVIPKEIVESWYLYKILNNLGIYFKPKCSIYQQIFLKILRAESHGFENT